MKHVTSIGYRRPREGGGPGQPFEPCGPWVPAFAGMTDKRLILRKSLWVGLLARSSITSPSIRRRARGEFRPVFRPSQTFCYSILTSDAARAIAIRRMTTTPYPYLVFYEITETEIIIHAVRHAARDPSCAPNRAAA